MSVVAPIHVEAVGLANLRFFAPPNGAREFPWLSINDLHASLTLPRILRREFAHRFRSSEWKNDTRTVATVDGITNIVPHFMAQGLIDALSELGYIDPVLFGRYAAAGAKAMSKLTAGFTPAETMAFVADAWRAAGGNAGAST